MQSLDLITASVKHGNLRFDFYNFGSKNVNISGFLTMLKNSQFPSSFADFWKNVNWLVIWIVINHRKNKECNIEA